MTDISVIGLGAMGSSIAQTLLQNGFSVTVWNRSSEKSKSLVSAGAILANSAKDAVFASPATITCVASHLQTIEILSYITESLRGKTIIELSTGNATDAEALTKLLSKNDADWLIGIINAFPTAIGKKKTVLMMTGDDKVWDKWCSVINKLGGNSTLIGTDAGILATMFAALFTIRQGFMFGMIYGGILCRKAGIPLDTFAKQIPVSLAVLPSQHQLFSDTVPMGKYDDPPAAMKTYAQALENAMNTYKVNEAPCEMLQLFSSQVDKGMEAGLDEKALTSLVDLLANYQGKYTEDE